MVRRCTSPNDGEYTRFGGAGVAIAERWLTFELFLADMGPRPEGTALGRHPNGDGNFEPGNVRWAPKRQTRADGTGSIVGGYVIVYRPEHPNAGRNGYVPEHRKLMADSLDRPLFDDENVHHKNGVRTDNRLTKGHELGGCPPSCCNLELWSKRQPPGQRVVDKIAWARDILRRYCPTD